MDRFIDYIKNQINVKTNKFKIQYGQIYRTCRYTTSSLLPYLKSNMDRFIVLAKFIIITNY